MLSDTDSVAVLLTRAATAARLACSVGTIDGWRAEDAKRLARGEQIEHIPWVRLRFGIRYRIADVDAYIERTAVPLGVMGEKRREKRTAT